jgi:hypothetical protein
VEPGVVEVVGPATTDVGVVVLDVDGPAIVDVVDEAEGNVVDVDDVDDVDVVEDVVVFGTVVVVVGGTNTVVLVLLLVVVVVLLPVVVVVVVSGIAVVGVVDVGHSAEVDGCGGRIVVLVVASVVVLDVLVEVLPGVTNAGVAGGRQIAAVCGGSEDVGGGACGVVVVVVVVVDVVFSTTVTGAIRSGILPSVPSVGSPMNSVSPRTPESANTTPLEMAIVVERSCHHPGGSGSYSGTSSTSNHPPSVVDSSPASASNPAALFGSGGGHISVHFHPRHVPSAQPIRRIRGCFREASSDFVAKLKHGSAETIHRKRTTHARSASMRPATTRA